MNKLFIFLIIGMVGVSFADPTLTWFYDVGENYLTTPHDTPWYYDSMHFIFTSDEEMDSCSVDFTLLGAYTDTFSRAGTLSNFGLTCTILLPYSDHHYYTAYGAVPKAYVDSVEYSGSASSAFIYQGCGNLWGNAYIENPVIATMEHCFVVSVPDVEIICDNLVTDTITSGVADDLVYSGMDGLYLYNCTVSNADASGGAVYLQDASNVDIEDCRIGSNDIALTFERVENFTVDNTFVLSDDSVGVYVTHSKNGSFDKVQVGLDSGGVGFWITQSEDMELDDSQSFNGDRNLFMYNSTNVNIQEFALHNASEWNALIVFSSDISIYGSRFFDAPVNLQLEGSDDVRTNYLTLYEADVFSMILNYTNNSIFNNTEIYESEEGVLLLEDSYNNSFYNSEIYDIETECFWLYDAGYTTIDGLIAYNCTTGIRDNTDNTAVYNADITDTETAILTNNAYGFSVFDSELYGNDYGMVVTASTYTDAFNVHFYNNTNHDFTISDSDWNDFDNMTFDNPLGNYVNHSVIGYVDTAMTADEEYSIDWAVPRTPYPSHTSPLVSFREKAVNFTSTGLNDPALEAVGFYWDVSEEAGYYPAGIKLFNYIDGVGWYLVGGHIPPNHYVTVTPYYLNEPLQQLALFNEIPTHSFMWQFPTPHQYANSTQYPITINFSSPLAMEDCWFDINVGLYSSTEEGVIASDSMSCSYEFPLFITHLSPDFNTPYYNVTGIAQIAGENYTTDERDFDYQGCGLILYGGFYTLDKPNIHPDNMMNAPADMNCLHIMADDVTIRLYNSSDIHASIQATYANGTSCDYDRCSNGYGIYATDVTGLELLLIGDSLFEGFGVRGFNNSILYLDNVTVDSLEFGTPFDSANPNNPIFNIVDSVISDGRMYVGVGLGFDYPDMALINSSATLDAIMLYPAPDIFLEFFEVTNEVSLIYLDEDSVIDTRWQMGLGYYEEGFNIYPFGFIPMYDSIDKIEVEGERYINSSNFFVNQLLIGGDGFFNVGSEITSDLTSYLYVELYNTSDNIPNGNLSVVVSGLGGGSFGGCGVAINSDGEYYLFGINTSIENVYDFSTPIGSGIGYLSYDFSCLNEDTCELECTFFDTVNMQSNAITIELNNVSDDAFIPSLISGIISENGAFDEGGGELSVFLSNYSLYYDSYTIYFDYLNFENPQWNVSSDNMDVTYLSNGTLLEASPNGYINMYLQLSLIGLSQLIAIDTEYLPEFEAPAQLTFIASGMDIYYGAVSVWKYDGFTIQQNVVYAWGIPLPTSPTLLGYMFGSDIAVYQLNVSSFSSYALGDRETFNPLINSSNLTYYQWLSYSDYTISNGDIVTDNTGYFRTDYKFGMQEIILSPLLVIIGFLPIIVLAMLGVFLIKMVWGWVSKGNE